MTTPTSSLSSCLTRIERLDARIGAFTHLTAPNRQTNYSAPLRGLPMAIKANIAVAGLPWTGGIGAYRDRIAPVDAHSVAALRDAGAALVGLTNMDEGALGAITDNPWFGRTRNPWQTDHVAGGSSGGSAAAVAAEFCAAALGTDTFGSVRIPAAYTGMFGLKPRHGAISLDGVVPLASRFDHVGIIAPSAALCGLVLDAIGREADQRPPDNPSIGWLEDGESADEVTTALLARCISRSGLPVRSIDLPGYRHANAFPHALLIAESESFRYHQSAIARNRDGFGSVFLHLIEWGGRQDPQSIVDAHGAIDDMWAMAERALAGVDALLSPTVPEPAHRFGAKPVHNPSLHTLLASILGWPAVAFPIGVGPDGLPRSGQVMSRTGSRYALNLAARLAPAQARLPQDIN